MIDLNMTIDPASGWRLITATGINDSGYIVANGKNKAGKSHALLLTPVVNVPVAIGDNASPQTMAERPAKPKGEPKRKTGPSLAIPPTGRVKIVNRGTGTPVRGDLGPFRIEPAGDFQQDAMRGAPLVSGDCGVGNQARYASRPPQERHQRFLGKRPDSNSPSMLWEIKSLGDGFWRITNRATGKCLEMRRDKKRVPCLAVSVPRWGLGATVAVSVGRVARAVQIRTIGFARIKTSMLYVRRDGQQRTPFRPSQSQRLTPVF